MPWFSTKSLIFSNLLVAQAESACSTRDPRLVPGQEDPLEKEMAMHSSILAWKIPWMEELGRPQFMVSQESNMTAQLRHAVEKKLWFELLAFLLNASPSAPAPGSQRWSGAPLTVTLCLPSLAFFPVLFLCISFLLYSQYS